MLQRCYSDTRINTEWAENGFFVRCVFEMNLSWIREVIELNIYAKDKRRI